MAKMITVFGATGIQGGSVVRALLEDETFMIRAVTRTPSSAKARELAEKGVEIVKGNYDDISSLERAMAGSYGVYAVTDYFVYYDQDKERQAGVNIIDVARKVGVTHLVYSGLQSVSRELGKSCEHFDGKAEVEKYLLGDSSSSSSSSPSNIPYKTVVRFAEYMECLLLFFPPTRVEDGLYSWDIPMEGKAVDMIHAGSAGSAILSVFKNPDKYNGRTIGLSGDRKTIQEYCDVINKYTAPVRVITGKVTAEEFGRRDFPMAKEFGVMFEFYQSEYPSYNIDETRDLDPGTHDFDDFVQLNKEKIISMLK